MHVLSKSGFAPFLFGTSSLLVALFAVASEATVKIDGSSTVYPITEAVSEAFQETHPDFNVTVGIAGTGGGFKKFCRGETDISNASRPILAKEMETCRTSGVKYIEIPVAYDALTVAIHPKNTWLKQVTVEELKQIWEPAAQGTVLRWSQVNPKWPDQAIKLYGPGKDSGTFDYFTEAVVGKAKSSRTDYTASEDDHIVVQGVSRDLNGLGYFGYAYFNENKKKLKAVPVVAANGTKGILPTPATVENGSYQPLSRPLFIYVNAKSLDRPAVRSFTEFYLKNAAKLVKEVKYIPLPAKVYALNQQHVTKNKTGTVFGGNSEVGLKIETLVAMEAKE